MFFVQLQGQVVSHRFGMRHIWAWGFTPGLDVLHLALLCSSRPRGVHLAKTHHIWPRCFTPGHNVSHLLTGPCCITPAREYTRRHCRAALRRHDVLHRVMTGYTGSRCVALGHEVVHMTANCYIGPGCLAPGRGILRMASGP